LQRVQQQHSLLDDNSSLQQLAAIERITVALTDPAADTSDDGSSNDGSSAGDVASNQKKLSIVDIILIVISAAIFLGLILFVVQFFRDRGSSISNSDEEQPQPHSDGSSANPTTSQKEASTPLPQGEEEA